MAKDFTSKDAQEIINKHQNLLSMLRDVKNASEQVDNEIRQRAVELVSSGKIKKIILSYCMRLENRDIYSAPISDLIHSLYKHHKIQPTVDTAQSFYDTAAPSVKSNMALLKPACSRFTWLFANRKAKVGAEQAYSELNGMLEESYCKLTPYLKQEVDNVNNLSQDESWDAYLESPTLFATTLNKVLGAAASRKMSINPFDEQLSGIAKLEKKINACPKTIETDSIRKSAESMAAQVAMQILRGIPVEELNRNGGGFRIKALKDAGYTTMADIYAASRYQLSSVYGVSENAAFSIKRIAAQFLSKASSDVKIKLSADDRDKQSTELVTQIYLYRKKKSYLEELTDLVETNRLPLDNARDGLITVSDGLEWLFYSEEQRVDVRDSYDVINYVVNGEYTRRVTALTDHLRFGRINTAPDIVWDDFKHHNIEYISILEDIVPGLLGNDDGMYGLPEDLAREIQEEVFFPDGLLCTLRRYQEWGVKYILHQKKVLL